MHIMPASGTPQYTSRPAELSADAKSARASSSRAADIPPLTTGSIPEHDRTLLIAALQDIESKRLAIESLLDAGLMWQCLT
jgi:hypothetical protein